MKRVFNVSAILIYDTLQTMSPFADAVVRPGRNFGLKSGGTNSEGERGALGSQDKRGDNGEVVSPSTRLRVWESVMSLCGPERSAGRKQFYCNLISVDRLCWQQIAANSSPFYPKSGGTVLQSKKLEIPVYFPYPP